jgi:Tfp pilus assembly pilus retraction ATPase PilT/CheY-like chemotaxis protein
VEGRTVELRVSTVPTREAEKAVLRVLAQSGSQRVKEILLPEDDVARIEQLIRHRDGIVIVTGPTGSGKTTTLYAIVRELANGEVNVMTVEDPVEYEIPGITQIQVESRRNVTFASALRAILRQDPDVILVGEIRDLETAQVALQASMTGHLVLGTLHTNHAAGAIARLVDLGVDRPSLAGTVRGVVAQRLVRRLCPDCSTPIGADATEAERLLAKRFGIAAGSRANGCPNCGQTGYLGRIPVTEVMAMNADLVDRIARGATAPELERAALAAGMRTLRDSALARAAKGETTLEEVERVLGERATEAAASAAAAPTATAKPALAVVQGKPAPEASAPGKGKKGKDAASRAATKGARILVVDDDPVHRSLACRALEKAGFEVDEVPSGAAALEKTGAGETYALIVTDLNMPGLGGREVVTCLRALPRTAAVPIVVATSEEEADTEAQLIEAGADDYIRKPLEPARFVARIQAALRRAA